MIKLIIAVFAISIPSFAVNSRRVVASAAAPIPRTYSASDSQSLILSELPQRDKSIALTATMSSIACDISAQSSTTAPVTNDGSAPDGLGLEQEVYLIASETKVLLNSYPGKNIYCRSFDGAAKTAGEIYVITY